MGEYQEKKHYKNTKITRVFVNETVFEFRLILILKDTLSEVFHIQI